MIVVVQNRNHYMSSSTTDENNNDASPKYQLHFTVRPAPHAPSPTLRATGGWGDEQRADGNSFLCECPLCGRRVPKVLVRERSRTQWLWCMGLFLVFPLACWVPFCCRRCDDIREDCSACQGVIGYNLAPCCP